MHTHIRTYVRTYVRTYAHTHIPTHTYIYIHYIALHCITLHYIALHCITLHYIALQCIAFFFCLTCAWVHITGPITTLRRRFFSSFEIAGAVSPSPWLAPGWCRGLGTGSGWEGKPKPGPQLGALPTPFWGEGSPTKTDKRKKGTRILSSLPEDPEKESTVLGIKPNGKHSPLWDTVDMELVAYVFVEGLEWGCLNRTSTVGSLSLMQTTSVACSCFH